MKKLGDVKVDRQITVTFVRLWIEFIWLRIGSVAGVLTL
jgi:hypothetical protein